MQPLHLYTILAVAALLGAGMVLLRILGSRARTKAAHARSYLRVLIPKKESREDREKGTERDFREAASIMEPLLASLHSLHEESMIEKLFRVSCFTLEYVVSKNEIVFFASCPRAFRSLMEKQISAQYPDAVVEESAPPNIFAKDAVQSATTLVLKREQIYPIRTYKVIESDPINGITNALSKLGAEDGALVQILLRPASDSWQKAAQKKAKAMMNSEEHKGFFALLTGGSSEKKEPKRLTPSEEEVVKQLQEKAGKVGFDTVVRIVVSSPEPLAAKSALRELTSAFAQFTDPDTNTFQSKTVDLKKILPRAIYRTFAGAGKSCVLNTEELTSLFHFPHLRYNLAPTIKWQNFKIAPAPSNLLKEGVLLGTNVYRGVTQEVRLGRDDRFRHLYAIGQTGTGKSTMLLNLALQDIANGQGVAVLDPHGDLAKNILGRIPKERAKDVIYFNAADLERPMGLNILEAKEPDDRDFVVNEALSIMIKLFGAEIFGPRLQDYFRNGVLTLMEDEDGGALTDLVRLFSDDDWQKMKVRKVQNPIVREWWEHTFAGMGQREKQEMVPFWAAKFGQFITNNVMRNIIGQTKSAFDFSDVMNNGKVLLINVSKGELGDFNSSLIGMIVVSKLAQAAFQRGKMDQADRRDFYLYIDEFQNFVTDSIENILSEARKYRLSLNVAHQYIGQLVNDRNEKIKNAIFGNVGSMVAFKVGAPDAEFLQKEFQPVFTDQDLINIDVSKAAIKLSVDGQPSRPFSLNARIPYGIYPNDRRLGEAIVQLSRLTHGRDRRYVDREIITRIGSSMKLSPPPTARQALPPSGTIPPYTPAPHGR